MTETIVCLLEFFFFYILGASYFLPAVWIAFFTSIFFVDIFILSTGVLIVQKQALDF